MLSKVKVFADKFRPGHKAGSNQLGRQSERYHAGLLARSRLVDNDGPFGGRKACIHKFIVAFDVGVPG